MAPGLTPTPIQFGGLDALEFPAPAGAPSVVLLHGYGASKEDLVGLRDVLDPSGLARWIFPDAPLEIRNGPFPIGRAWFDIDILAMQDATAKKDFPALAELIRPGLDRGVDAALALLKEAALDPAKLVLGGFSQGAMVATHAFFKMAVDPAGLAIFSGGLAGERSFLRPPRRSPGEIFLCHGRWDPVLPFDLARALDNGLQEAGWETRFFPFEGGHEIPPEACASAADYFASKLS